MLAPFPQAATTLSIDPVAAAWTKFLLAVMDARPHRLNALNSPAALAGRVQDIDAQIIACRDWLKALLEDTAQHCYPARRLEDVVETYMGDLASEVRGELVLAMEDRGVRL